MVTNRAKRFIAPTNISSDRAIARTARDDRSPKAKMGLVLRRRCMNNPIEFWLSVEDEQATDEELQTILGTLAAELEDQSAAVMPVALAKLPPQPGMVEKGEPSSSILDVKINLDTLQTFGKWLYDRLVGTTTKVKFEYEAVKFEFEGRNDRDRAAAMQDFENFVARLEAAKQAKHG